MPQAFLKPENEKLKIRHPITGEYLPAHGVDVELTSFWRRRIKDGDVVELKGTDADKARAAINAKAKAAAKKAAAEVKANQTDKGE